MLSKFNWFQRFPSVTFSMLRLLKIILLQNKRTSFLVVHDLVRSLINPSILSCRAYIWYSLVWHTADLVYNGLYLLFDLEMNYHSRFFFYNFISLSCCHLMKYIVFITVRRHVCLSSCLSDCFIAALSIYFSFQTVQLNGVKTTTSFRSKFQYLIFFLLYAVLYTYD